MMYKFPLIKQIIVILFFFTSGLFSDYDKKYTEPFEQLKIEKSKGGGSGFVQRKPDTACTLTKKLAEKALRYIQIHGKENALKIFTEKYRKFRKYNTYLFALDMQGNVLAHTGNTNFVNTNLFDLKDFSGRYFIQDYVNTMKQVNHIDYTKFYSNNEGKLYLIKYIHLERLDEDCFLGTVAIERY